MSATVLKSLQSVWIVSLTFVTRTKLGDPCRESGDDSSLPKQ